MVAERAPSFFRRGRLFCSSCGWELRPCSTLKELSLLLLFCVSTPPVDLQPVVWLEATSFPSLTSALQLSNHDHPGEESLLNVHAAWAWARRCGAGPGPGSSVSLFIFHFFSFSSVWLLCFYFSWARPSPPVTNSNICIGLLFIWELINISRFVCWPELTCQLSSDLVTGTNAFARTNQLRK